MIRALQDAGATVLQKLDLINAALVQIPPVALAGLANNPNVRYISPDRGVKASLEYAEPTTNASVAFSYGWTGKNVWVAVLDSGINANHPDLLGRTYADNLVLWEPTNQDLYGHGSHVAGIIAGNAKASTGAEYTRTFRGIAPGSSILSERVLDSNGVGTDSTVISGIQRVIQYKNTYGIPRIINLSLGRPALESYTLDPLCQAVEQAWKAGIVVVVAAGNQGRNNSVGTNGYGTIASPGNDPYVITVGAMKDMSTVLRSDDLVASYSSKGPTAFDHIVKPDLVAPGNGIVSLYTPASTLATSFPSNAIPWSYYSLTSFTGYNYLRLSGTSMSTPMVSGAVALMLQKTPSLTPDQVKARLMKTATKTFPLSSFATDPLNGITYTSYYDIFTIGAGYLDVWAALNNTDSVTAGAALSPTAVYDPLTSSVSIVNTTSVVWGDTGFWGTSVVWGDGMVWGNSIFSSGTSTLAGTSVVWGDSTTFGFSVVWGDSIVWGDSRLASESIIAIGEN
jgi:serine protease AprX